MFGVYFRLIYVYVLTYFTVSRSGDRMSGRDPVLFVDYCFAIDHYGYYH